MKSSVDFSIRFCGKYGLTMLSKNFAKEYCLKILSKIFFKIFLSDKVNDPLLPQLYLRYVDDIYAVFNDYRIIIVLECRNYI